MGGAAAVLFACRIGRASYPRGTHVVEIRRPQRLSASIVRCSGLLHAKSHPPRRADCAHRYRATPWRRPRARKRLRARSVALLRLCSSNVSPDCRQTGRRSGTVYQSSVYSECTLVRTLAVRTRMLTLICERCQDRPAVELTKFVDMNVETGAVQVPPQSRYVEPCIVESQC